MPKNSVAHAIGAFDPEPTNGYSDREGAFIVGRKGEKQMTVLEIEYKGGDIVISKDTAEKKLGLHPGDRVTVFMSPKVKLVPIKKTLEEKERLRELLDPTPGSWSEADEEAFNKLREALWSTWQLPKSV